MFYKELSFVNQKYAQVLICLVFNNVIKMNNDTKMHLKRNTE